jgi:DNA-binding response OmpR family regulator
VKILVAEDDYIYNESIKEYLVSIGYSVDAFFDGESALNAILNKEYHILLIDIKIPKLSGYELMRDLRQTRIKTPIIIMTALVDINDIITGYELGCNDYIKKPFELKELELRINEIVKKTQYENSDDIIKTDVGIIFNTAMDKLQKDGGDVALTSKELSIVRFLIRKKNIFCSIKSLKENIWKSKEVSCADIRMHIRKIRLKTDKNFIKSSKGLGYKIDALV